MIRVLLVENTRLVRGAFAALLSREDDIEVVAEADGNGDVVARAVACRPDVAVIDVDSGEGEEVAVRGELRARLPECRMLLMMASTTPERLRRMLDLHAAGVISTNAPPDRLVHGVRKLVRGQRFVDPEFALAALDAGANPLTPREVEVLRRSRSGCACPWRRSATICRRSPGRRAAAIGSMRSGSLWSRAGCEPGRSSR
ncbi:putative transcriptional regulatory protein DesR [Streptomyces afghaniensis 772]|uniref:Putative transcriptional regulatory protein DesR n=1 Tax=Streptomyces afghaniensis 772 TaxID=1283301 RepID=S4MYX1_9ACTN|nr:putative transcriptional regulatory protein DesR [Streptomyces afghaniensis 772]